MWSFVGPVIAIICVSLFVCTNASISVFLCANMHASLVSSSLYMYMQVNSLILLLTVAALVKGRKKGGAETNVKRRALVV